MVCYKVIVLFVLSSVVLCDEVFAKQKRYLMKTEGGYNNHGYSFDGAQGYHMQHYHHAHQPIHHEVLKHHQQHHDPSNIAQNHYHQISNQNEEHHHSKGIHTHDEHHNHKIKKITLTKKVPVPYEVIVEKKVPYKVEVPVDKPYNVYVPKPYPVYVEKKVPYKVEIPVPKPYTVEKKVPVPVKVPVDKPYPVYIPKLYKVFVEKRVPYILEKHVPYPVKVPVEKPYPVHVKVEKEIPYKVEKVVHYPVKVPVDKPVLVHVKKPVPVKIEKPVFYPVEKLVPYPVKVPVKIPVKVPYLMQVQTHEGISGGGNSGGDNSYGISADGNINNFENGFYGTSNSDGSSSGHPYEFGNDYYVGGASEGASSGQHYGFEIGHHSAEGGKVETYSAHPYGMISDGASSSHLFGYENGYNIGSNLDKESSKNSNHPYGTKGHPYGFVSDHNSGHSASVGLISADSFKHENIADGGNADHSYQFGNNEHQVGGNLEQSAGVYSNGKNSDGSYSFENGKQSVSENTDGKSLEPHEYEGYRTDDSSSAGSGDTSEHVHQCKIEYSRGNSENVNGDGNNAAICGKSSSTSYGLKSNQLYHSGNSNGGNTYGSDESNKNSYSVPNSSSGDDSEHKNWGSIAANGGYSYSYVSGSHLGGNTYSTRGTIAHENLERTSSSEPKKKSIPTTEWNAKEESDHSTTPTGSNSMNPVKT